MQDIEYFSLIQDVLDTMTEEELKNFILLRAEFEDAMNRTHFLNTLRSCSKKLQSAAVPAIANLEVLNSLQKEAQDLIDHWNTRDPETLVIRVEGNEDYYLDDWDDPELTEWIVRDPHHLSEDLAAFIQLIRRSLIFGQTDTAEKLAVALCTRQIKDLGDYVRGWDIYSQLESDWFEPLDGFQSVIKELCLRILQHTEFSPKERIQRIAPLLIRLPVPNTVISSYASNMDNPPEDRDAVLLAMLETVEEEPLAEIFNDGSYLLKNLIETTLLHLSDHQKKAEVMLKFLPSIPSLFLNYFKKQTDLWDPAEKAALIDKCLNYLSDADDVKLAYQLLDTIYTKECLPDEAAAARCAFASRPGFNTYAKYAKLNPEGMNQDHLDLILSKISQRPKTMFLLLEGDDSVLSGLWNRLYAEPREFLPVTVLLLAYLYKPRKGRVLPEYLSSLLNRKVVNPLKWLEYRKYDDSDLENYDYPPDDADENTSIYPLLKRMRKRMPITVHQRGYLVGAISSQLSRLCGLYSFCGGLEEMYEITKYMAALEYVSYPLPNKSDRFRAESIARNLMKQDPSFRKSLEAWRAENNNSKT